ncbi:MAG: hypothetical protein RLZ98_2743 [Pseudomonadota bacterium]
MHDRIFSGVIAPVLTPFDADGVPDPERFADHAKWLIDSGCTALAPFGTTSEANSLGLDERMELLEDLVDAGIDARILMPGTGMCSVTDAAILSQHAVDLGCGGVLMLPPFYYKNPSDEGLYEYYARVIEDIADDRLRVYLYHYPQMSSVPISLDLVGRLTEEYPECVVGLKDSSGDRQNLMSLLQRFPNLEIFPGTEKLMLDGLRQGAAGVISATANIAAGSLRAQFDGWEGEDAERRQQAITSFRESIERYPPIPALKAVLAHYLDDPEWRLVRPPLVAMTEDAAEQAVKALSDEHGFTLRFD